MDERHDPPDTTTEPAAAEATVTIAPETGVMGPRVTGLREGLRRLGAGLVVYGVIGLIVAILGLAALLWVSGRVDALTDRIANQVESIAATLDETATVIEDASGTASSFAVTIERTPPSIRQAARIVGSVQTNLRALETQLGDIAILGARPLAGAAARFGEIATQLDGLDARLEQIAADLEGNRDALLANADSLGRLAPRIEALAADVRGGFVTDSLADVGAILAVLIITFVAWTAVPAVGALGVGLWLRSEVDTRDDD